MILKIDFRKQGRVIILRFLNVTLLIVIYNIFQVVNSWLDKVLGPFLHTVDDGFRDFRTNAFYLLVDRFLKLNDSLGIIFIYFSFK